MAEQPLVDRELGLGDVVGGHDVEDALEVMRHAQPRHDALGMRHRAVGEDHLAAVETGQRGVEFGIGDDG